MEMFRLLASLLCFFVYGGQVGAAESSASVILNELRVLQATRTLDIASQLVKETVVYEIENAAQSTISYFVVGFEKKFADGHLAIVEAAKSLDDDISSYYKVEKTAVANNKEDVFYRVNFPTGLAIGKRLKFEVLSVYAHSLKPYPAYILQAEQQFVVYEGSRHVFSPYAIKEQTTKVQLSPGTVESYTKPAKQDGQVLTYGPFPDVAAYSKTAELRVHYENNSPFLTVVELTRLIEISHWGNIAVEETLDVVHNGAKLKGSFSRYDFQRDHRQNSPAVKSFKTLLPAAAVDVYYRDEIGNISTSNLRPRSDAVELEIRPRFPLFGGWKTHYYIGYNVLSYEYLFNSGHNYALKMRFVDHIYDNFVVDKITLKVILPEGCKDIKLKAPYDVQRKPDEVHYTYLDTSGRPVVIVRKDLLVEDHIRDFELDYTFDRLAMVREPLLLIIALYLLFFVIIVYVRLDFTIAKDATSEARLKASGLIEQALSTQADRTGAYETWLEAIEKYKTSRDNAALASARKKIDADVKKLTETLTDIQTTLKPDCPDGSEKLGEIQKLDKVIKEKLVDLTQAAERLATGKLQRAQFIDVERQAKAKIEELKQKTDQIIFTL